jgi:hypothetical protein
VPTVQFKTTGRGQRAPSFGVPLPDGATDGGLTLRELITLAVREELAARGDCGGHACRR